MRADRADDPERESLLRAIVALSRYSVDITEIANQSLGPDSSENRDLQMLLALHRNGPATPTVLAERTGAPRSTVSRALNRLQADGLIARGPDSADRRCVLVRLTPKGRRRIAAFAARVGDYFAAGEPLLKEVFHLLGAVSPERRPGSPADPLTAAAAMSRVGAGYETDVTRLLEPFGVREFADRFTLLLIHLYGAQRPTQIAQELLLTPSGTSGVLARLDTAGLITRRHDLTPGDRRAVTLELTPTGEQAVGLQIDTFARHAHGLAEALALTW